MTGVLSWLLLTASAAACATGGLMHDPIRGAAFVVAGIVAFGLAVVCIVVHAAGQPIVWVDRS